MAATMDVSPTNATTTEIIADDDDAWLYGDEGKGNKENVQSDKIEKSDLRETNKTELNGITIKKEDREEGEMSGEEGDSQEKDEDSDDDDDDDDNVQVTIGDIKAWSASEQPRNLFKSGTNYQKTAAGGAPKTTVTTKGLDLEAQGTINGIPVFEFDLSTINNEDKPWRKPGADITDYFNYGFNEDTWQLYCEKQRRLIAMNEGTAPVPKIVTHHTTSASSRAEKESSAGSRRNITSTTKPVGQIDVIGATAKDSRRPESEGDPIPVAGAAHFTPRKFIPPPGMPPTTLPPPHMPPVDYSIPPPGLPMPHGVPPPGMPGMTVPPPGFPPVPDPYDHFHRSAAFFSVPPPDRSVPPPGFDERQAYGFNAPPQAFSNNAFADASRQGSSHQWETGGSYGERDWERDRERRGDGNRRDRSPHRSEEDFARNEEELHMLQMESLWRDRDRDHDRSRDRERSRERERERERGDRDRSDRRRERDILRSRSHDRDKERERERELERLSRVEEVKHRSRRSSSIRSDSVRSESRKHRDDSDTESVRSSKHKSRRRKREKDDEASESAVEREATKGE